MKNNILLVDDSRVVHAVVKDLMKNTDFVFHQAFNADEGREIIKSEKIELILLDVNMPGLSGTEFCRELKSGAHKEIPIVFVTSESKSEQIVKGIEAGANDYIAKPFCTEELLVRINNQLRISKLKKEALESEKIKAFSGMVVTLNHEINNPLTIAFGAISHIKKTIDKDDKHLNMLVEAVKRIKNIVDEISDLEKIEFEEYTDDGTKMIKLNS